jgi:UDPglucose 6-dehydrogenase
MFDLTSPRVTDCPEEVKKSIEIFTDAYSAVENTHAIVICTEWDEFTELNYNKIYQSMMKPCYIFDGRKILNHAELQEIGFHVVTIGKNLKMIKSQSGNIPQ